MVIYAFMVCLLLWYMHAHSQPVKIFEEDSLELLEWVSETYMYIYDVICSGIECFQGDRG